MMNVPSWIPIERPSTEMRRTSRADVHLEIDIYSDHNFWSGLSSNVSTGGIFVATHRTVPLGSCLFVQFGLPDGGEPIVALTEVRWTRLFRTDGMPPGLGLKFVEIDPTALLRIRAFVKHLREPLLFES